MQRAMERTKSRRHKHNHINTRGKCNPSRIYIGKVAERLLLSITTNIDSGAFPRKVLYG